MNFKFLNCDDVKVQTAINLISGLMTMVFGLAINFFLSPYIIKHLGIEANGYAQLAGNFIMFASLVSMALNSMSGRFIAMAYHQNNLLKARRYYTSTIVGNVVIAALFIIPAIFCIYKLESLIKIGYDVLDVKILFAFTFFNFFFGLLTGIFGIATYVTNRLYIGSIMGIIRTMLNAVIIIGLFYFFSPKIYFTTLTASVLTIIFTIATYKVKTILLDEIRFRRKDFRGNYIKKLLSSGLWNSINSAGHILMTGLDLLIANMFVSPVLMSMLAISKSIPNHVIQVGGLINGSFSPGVTMSHAKGDKEQLMGMLRTSSKLSSVMMSIPLVLFCYWGESFYKLWLPTVDARELVILSALGFIAFIPCSGTQVLFNVFIALNRLRFNSITFIINGVINIILLFVILKTTNWGIYAIAGLSSITRLIRIMTLTLPYTAKLLDLKWYVFYKDVAISIVCALVCLLACFGVGQLVHAESWVMLGIALSASSILALVGQMFVILNKNERIILISKLLRRA